MAKKNDKTLGYLLIGLAAVLLLRQRPAYNAYPQFPQAPPAPPTKGQAFSQWVNSILAIYGNVKELWEPGGPFSNINPADIQQAVDSPTSSSSSPYSFNPYDFNPSGPDVLV